MHPLQLAISTAVLVTVILAGVSCSSSPPPSRAAGIRAQCIPDAVAKRRAALTSAADPNLRLKVALQLPLRNQAELTRLLHDLYDPGSPQFHKYLSVSEFT